METIEAIDGEDFKPEAAIPIVLLPL